MLFFDVLPFTDDARVVNGKTSKKSVQNRRGGFWCVKALSVINCAAEKHATYISTDIMKCIEPLIGHCIAKWYAVFRYLVKITELETSWGRGDTVTY